MDPLSALSLAAAVAQFVDYGIKIVSGAREIYGSLAGATSEDQFLETATREMQCVLDKLVAPTSGTPTEEDRLLVPLIAECRTLSAELLALLAKSKATDPKSKFRSTLASMKSKIHEKEKQSLQRRVEQCRVRLEQLLNALSRFVPASPAIPLTGKSILTRRRQIQNKGSFAAPDHLEQHV